MLAYYGDKISPNMTSTPEGFLICHNVPIARTGNMIYLARELQLDGDPESPVTVTRDSAEVFDKAALASFEGKPVTDGHPSEDVSPDNYASYAKGHVQNVRQNRIYIVADLHISDPGLISEIVNNVKREISCGYHCMYEPSGGATFSQKQIRGNHVAVVPNGRAGKAVSIKDSAPAEQHKTERGNTIMRKDKTQGFLALFGRAAKDAAPEDIEQMAQDAAAVLNVEPAKKTNQEESALDEFPAAQEAAPQKNGVEAKLDQLLALITKAFASKDEQAELAPEEKMNKMIDELSCEKKETDAAPEGEAETIPAEEEKKSFASDAAASILKSARPAVAAIKDPAERNRVVDALLEAVKPLQVNSISNILSASKDVAKRFANDSAPVDIKEQQKAYDSRNPHKTKEEK